MTDLISRQAAKEKACSICRWEGTENCAECEHPIDDLPTIDPVKHGKWLLHEYPDGYYHTECSECGKVYSENVYFLRKPNYCPYCGARMERSEDERTD